MTGTSGITTVFIKGITAANPGIILIGIRENMKIGIDSEQGVYGITG